MATVLPNGTMHCELHDRYFCKGGMCLDCAHPKILGDDVPACTAYPTSAAEMRAIVVVGDAFARDTAEVMEGAGIHALVLPRPLPTRAQQHTTPVAGSAGRRRLRHEGFGRVPCL